MELNETQIQTRDNAFTAVAMLILSPNVPIIVDIIFRFSAQAELFSGNDSVSTKEDCHSRGPIKRLGVRCSGPFSIVA